MLQAQLPVVVPVTFLAFAVVAPLVGLWRRGASYWIAVGGTAVAWTGSVAGLLAVLSYGEVRYHLGGWPPPLGIEYVLDPLSAFVTAIVTSMGLLVIVYSGPLVRDESPGKSLFLYPVKLLLLAGLSGMVATGDLFNLFVFLEISSISAYALIAIGDDRRAPVAAFRYLILGSMGGGFYLLGVAFVYFSTGSLNMADVATLLPELYGSRVLLAAATLMVLGLGLKMALFPLHLWLPDAYTYSPYSVSSLIAPVMTKVSAYAIIRLFLDVFRPEYLRDAIPMIAAIGWLSAAGIVVGALLAIGQRDYRRMLAYSSVGQLGFVGLGIGLGSALGLIGALLHMVNHAVMKGCLFMVGGGIRFKTGLLDVPEFTGLGRKMPWVMACFTVAALSMVGIPPTAGFFSKWYLALAAVESRHWIFLAVIVGSSLLTAVYFFRVLENVYEKVEVSDPPERAGRSGATSDRSHPELAHAPVGNPTRRELPFAMLAPIAILAAGIVVLGLANVVIIQELLAPAALPLVGD